MICRAVRLAGVRHTLIANKIPHRGELTQSAINRHWPSLVTM